MIIIRFNDINRYRTYCHCPRLANMPQFHDNTIDLHIKIIWFDIVVISVISVDIANTIVAAIVVTIFFILSILARNA